MRCWAVSMEWTASSTAIHRDMRSGHRRECLPAPAGPAVAQAQPGELGHQVELGRPRVAQPHRQQSDAVRAQRHVLGVDALTERVVLASVQDDFVDRDAVDVRALLALNRVRSGTNASMTNTPAASGRATR